jgi:hypothetical protein
MVDFSKRFATFDKQIEAFAKRANMSVSKTIRGTSIALFRGVIKTSPVDTGRFRANWQISGASPASGTVNSFDKKGNDTVMEMATFINGEKVNLEFTLSNNLPYAAKLEYGGYAGDGPNTVGGFSKQAPQGMIRVNVARFQRLLDEAARENR